jgi:hypothetical protein
MAAIGDRGRELREITDKLFELRPGLLQRTLDELRVRHTASCKSPQPDFAS